MPSNNHRTFRTISGWRLSSLSASDLELLQTGVKKFEVERIRFAPGSQLNVSGLADERFESFCRFIEPLLQPPPTNGITSILSCNDCSSCKNGMIDSQNLVAGLSELDLPQPLPAKIKIGVAGCQRCCTMPRLRDVGFIPASARAKRWNISFGGNGGRNPRIGDLIGTNLSELEALDLAQKALIIYQQEASDKMRTAAYLREKTVENFLKILSKC